MIPTHLDSPDNFQGRCTIINLIQERSVFSETKDGRTDTIYPLCVPELCGGISSITDIIAVPQKLRVLKVIDLIFLTTDIMVILE